MQKRKRKVDRSSARRHARVEHSSRPSEQSGAPTDAEKAEVLRLFSGGQLDAAERLSVVITRKYPSHPFGWKALGGVRRLLGKTEESLEPMRRATRLAPEDAEAHSNLGKTLLDLGQLSAAEASYRQAIHLRPEYCVAHHCLGETLQRLGRLADAVVCYREVIRLEPRLAEPHVKLGALFADKGELKAAEESYRVALHLRPDSAAAHAGLGIVLKRLDRCGEAESSCREAIRLKPEYAEAHCNLGVVLEGLGQLGEAADCYLKAIQLNPLLAAAHNNLGNALCSLGQLERAETSYREAIRVASDYAEAYCNLGVVLSKRGKLKEAEASFKGAVRLRRDMPQAHLNLGTVLSHLGQLNSAEAEYREAIQLKLDNAKAHSNLGAALMKLGRFEEAEESLREAIRLNPKYYNAHSNLLFGLNYIDSLPVQKMLEEASRYGEIVSADAHPKFTSWLTVSDGPLRIGFVSGDLRNHPVGFFVEGLLKHLDRRLFELYAFSNDRKKDELTERIQPYFKDWILILGMSDLEVANVIHQRGINVLIDLSGHSGQNRLPVFAYKPAPVQVSWLGYFASTGLPEIDYFIGDPHVCPEEEAQHFTEKLWRLPESWFCLEPPLSAPPVAPLPAMKNGFITFGCFGNMSKIGPRVERLWSELLRRVPSARLFLKSNQFSDSQVVKEVEARFVENGVERERLILEAPSRRDEYYAAYSRVDIILDTFPYPGGTTSVDALWMGVPILTLKGDRFLSRLGESIARNAEMPDWIAEDESDYLQKAAFFASDLGRLETMRGGLRERLREGPLFNTKRFAENFGAALLEMYGAAATNL